MAEHGGPREQRVPADHDDRPVQGLNQNELLDLLSRRANAGEPYDDVKEALDQFRSRLVAPDRIDPQRVLDAMNTSVLDNRPAVDIRAESHNEAKERRRLGQEILDAKATVASVASDLSKRIRHLRDVKIRNEHMEDVRKIAEETARITREFSVRAVDSYSVENLEMLLADCSEALRQLRTIRVIIDDLPTLEKQS